MPGCNQRSGYPSSAAARGPAQMPGHRPPRTTTCRAARCSRRAVSAARRGRTCPSNSSVHWSSRSRCRSRRHRDRTPPGSPASDRRYSSVPRPRWRAPAGHLCHPAGSWGSAAAPDGSAAGRRRHPSDTTIRGCERSAEARPLPPHCRVPVDSSRIARHRSSSVSPPASPASGWHRASPRHCVQQTENPRWYCGLC